MAIDPEDFAQECFQQGSRIGAHPHYMLCIAQLRSGISDVSQGDQIGPFRLKQADWDANCNDVGLDIHFLPTQINDWLSQCAVFALMARRAFEAFVTKNNRNPSVRELYLQQFPDAQANTLSADLIAALSVTAALTGPAAEAVLDDPQSVSPPITDPDQSPTMPEGASNTEIDADQEHAVVAGKAAAIIAECEKEWPANRGDCSAFVRAVGSGLGVQLTGNANQIVDQIRGPHWHRLSDGRDAKIAAGSGQFVIGGLKGSDQSVPSEHGHVVVVVAGELDSVHHAYPLAYWGKLGDVGEKKKSINFAWRDPDRDHVIYAAFVG